VRVSEGGKPSRTDFLVREATEQASWLEARLHTGRTHQIRVHAQASGHPVVGDRKYASAVQQAWTEADQALWAGVLNSWFLGRVLDKVRR
jgi:23S rRNA-/tRNA-specific pseudouridylate synthase